MSADTLSDLLRTVRLTGAVYFSFDLSSPWVAEAPAAKELAPIVMPGSEHLIEFHVIAKGACWAHLIDGTPIKMEAGDVIVLPQGDPHVLASTPGLRAEPNWEIHHRVPGQQWPLVLSEGGGGPDRAHVICGFLGCDLRPFNPLVAALPRIIHLNSRRGPSGGWLDPFIGAVLAESEQKRPGGENVLARLAELMFIEVVRRHFDGLPAGQLGWLAGLRDRHVGRALVLMHERPAHPWTIEELAKEAGLSRSALAERFSELVGQPPIQYLAQWRMQVAAAMLANGGESVASVAEKVGYESEAAFNRAFTRAVGVGPGAWRKARLNAS